MMRKRLFTVVLVVAANLLLLASNAFCIEITGLQIKGLEGIKVDEHRRIFFQFKVSEPPDAVNVRFEGTGAISDTAYRPVAKEYRSDSDQLHFEFTNETVTARIWFLCPYILAGNKTLVKVWVENKGIGSNKLQREVVITNAPYTGKEKWASWTPLPDDIKIIPPESTIPPTIRKFSGIWQGRWKGAEHRNLDALGLKATVIVERIEESSQGFKAQVLYSTSDISPPYRPYWSRTTGSFENEVLVFRSPAGVITELEMRDNDEIYGWWLGRYTSGIWLERRSFEHGRGHEKTE